MDKDYISERLATLRMQAGISAREISLSLGQNEHFISDIENKKSVPSMQSFLSICDFFKITPTEFFDKENSNPVLLNKLISELIPLNGAELEDLFHLLLESQDKIKD